MRSLLVPINYSLFVPGSPVEHKFSITTYCSAGTLPLAARPFPAELLGVVDGVGGRWQT